MDQNPITPAPSEGAVSGFLSKTQVLSIMRDPQVNPHCAQAHSHRAEVCISFSQSSDFQGHQNRSDIGIFYNANHQQWYFFLSIQLLSFLLEVVTNRQ